MTPSVGHGHPVRHGTGMHIEPKSAFTYVGLSQPTRGTHAVLLDPPDECELCVIASHDMGTQGAS